MWDCCMLVLVSFGLVLDFKWVVDWYYYLWGFLVFVLEFNEIRHTQELLIKFTI